jgi:hypothetical protein
MDHHSPGLWDAAQRRQMSTPLLLFVSGHAPLAFIAGQALYVVAPLATLLGWDAPQAWAAALSLPKERASPQEARRS